MMLPRPAPLPLGALLLGAALLLAGPPARADGRSTAEVQLLDAFLLLPDGTPYRPALDYADYHLDGSLLTRRIGEQVQSYHENFYWSVAHCDGACDAFPPNLDTTPYGGYANASSGGWMLLGGPTFSYEILRADSGATSSVPVRAQTVAETDVRFHPPAGGQGLTLAFDAAPYVDQYLGPGEVDASAATARLQFRFTFSDATTGQLLREWNPAALNASYDLFGSDSPSTFIYNPGATHYILPLDGLVADHVYELHFQHTVETAVLLAVPEPGAGGMFLSGLAALCGYSWRRRRRLTASASPSSTPTLASQSMQPSVIDCP
jgi:hypothetical protein